MILISKENNKTLENLHVKISEKMNDRGVIAYNLLSPLSKTINLEHTSQPKLVKDPKSNRVNDLLTNKTIPFTLCDNLLTFRDR